MIDYDLNIIFVYSYACNRSNNRICYWWHVYLTHNKIGEGVLEMTQEEAQQLIHSLTYEQKITLYQMLSSLKQSPEPFEPQTGKDSSACQ